MEISDFIGMTDYPALGPNGETKPVNTVDPKSQPIKT